MNDWLSYKASGSAKNDPNSIQHWGVKGMKWGKHTDEYKQAEAEYRYVDALNELSDKINSSSNSDRNTLRKLEIENTKKIETIDNMRNKVKGQITRYKGSIDKLEKETKSEIDKMTADMNKFSNADLKRRAQIKIDEYKKKQDIELSALKRRLTEAENNEKELFDKRDKLLLEIQRAKRSYNNFYNDRVNSYNEKLNTYYKITGQEDRVRHSFEDDSGYLEHAMTLKQLLTREGVKEFLSTNQINRTKAWAATLETLSEAANKMVTNLNNFPKATNIKGLTESKKIVEQSSRLYKYIEDYKGELNDYTVEITEIIFNTLSKKYSDLSLVTDGLKQARDSFNEMGKVMTYTINAFKNNCDVVMSGFKIERKALEKQINAFTNSKLREEYQRRIDALDQSIKTVENMKAEVAGLKHSFEDDSEYLEHWGVKGMKWGHHNQSEQKEKQYEADKRLEAAKAILDAKKTIETAAKEMKRAQDDIEKSLALVNSLSDSYKRAYERYIRAKPEQKDALFNARTTIYNKLKTEVNNLNNLELTISDNRRIIDNKRLSLNSLGSMMSGADAVMLDNIETDNGLWYDLRDMHKKCADAQKVASKVLSSHEETVYDKSRVFKR